MPSYYKQSEIDLARDQFVAWLDAVAASRPELHTHGRVPEHRGELPEQPIQNWAALERDVDTVMSDEHCLQTGQPIGSSYCLGFREIARRVGIVETAGRL